MLARADLGGGLMGRRDTGSLLEIGQFSAPCNDPLPKGDVNFTILQRSGSNIENNRDLFPPQALSLGMEHSWERKEQLS